MTRDSNPKKRTIVIAVDESPVSKEALEWSVNNLIHKNDNVRLLSVIDSENRPAYGTPGGIPLEMGASDTSVIPLPSKVRMGKARSLAYQWYSRMKMPFSN